MKVLRAIVRESVRARQDSFCREWDVRALGEARPIRFKTTFRTTIYDVLKWRAPLWQEVKEGAEWDIFWADVTSMKESFDNFHMEDHMRINHFRNHYELTKKNMLVKNMKRHRKLIERECGKAEAAAYDFLPTTFEMPGEYALFVEEFRRCPKSAWIMKPAGRAQGKGIFLFNKLSQITDWKNDYRWTADKRDDKEPVEAYIAQRYIENPLLVGGKKFDLRIYVLVTSYVPLVVWLYRSGFARFSSTRFSMDFKEITNNYIHLTNVAIQKKSATYDTEKGCKWPLHRLKMYLLSRFGADAVRTLFLDMQSLILRSLLGVQKIMINDKHCFELYGYDILIDDTLKPWLLEVNASPSLTADTAEDHELKFVMLNEMLNIIDMDKKLTGNEKRVGGFDIIWKDGPTDQPDLMGQVDPLRPTLPQSTFLGCEYSLKKPSRLPPKPSAPGPERRMPGASHAAVQAAQASTSSSAV